MTEHKQWDYRNLNLNRSINIGSRCLELSTIISLENGILCEKAVLISEAVMKVIDEILVNASDHYYKKCDTNNPVTYIQVKYSNKNNIILVKNDGLGMPVIKEWDGCKNKDTYLPNALISQENTSSNYNENEKDRIYGGSFGQGSKIVNIYAKNFQLTTIDSDRKLKYSIQYYNNLEGFKNETVTHSDEKSYTEIMWLPDYEKLCKCDTNDWIQTNKTNIPDILFSRLLQISVFINTIDFSHKCNKKIIYSKKPRCFYNKLELNYNLEDYVKMFGLKDYVKINLTNLKFPWYIIIGLRDELKLVTKKSKLFTISLINSIHISNGGSHVNLITRYIIRELEKRADITISEAQFNNIFCYFDCKHIPVECFDFGSQTKNKITINVKSLNELKKDVVIDDSIIKYIWEMSEQQLMINVIKKDMSSKLSKINKCEYKHDPAVKRKTQSYKCGLFIPEGDSACTPVRNMIKHKKTPIDKNYYGTYIIQGVPPNAIKNILKKYIDTTNDNKEILHLSDKLLFSNHFNGLMNSIGLKYDDHYQKNDEGNLQFKKLSYSHIIMATDQDLDGIGHICSLVMIFIMKFWPALVERDFFRRLATPIIRIYQGKKKIKEFYSEKEYDLWVITKYGKLENLPATNSVKYYKGLGTNSDKEMFEIGMNIFNNIFTMKKDNDCYDYMNKLYGKSTDDRKKILTKEVTNTYPKEIWTKHEIDITDHFTIETVEFQLSNMRRKLKHFIDGMIPSQRKVLCGARSLFINNKGRKVFQIGGYIADKMCYDHGDMSLNGVITKMAQKYDGANNIPQLIPVSGGFGTRTNGRDDNCSPRYICATYNKICDLLYPRKDDALLEYVYEDGSKCEPKYYVPIIPISILENEKTPGTGWKITVWARDYDATIKFVKALINDKKTQTLSGKLWNRHKKMIFNTSPIGTEYCYGRYSYNKLENRIYIQELPIRTWSNSFKNKHMGIHPKTGQMFKTDRDGNKNYLTKTKFIKHIQDDTANHEVNMYIDFADGDYKNMKEHCEENDIEVDEFLKLKKKLTPELNMINDKNYITEFPNYDEIVNAWFPFRKNLYIARITREMIILEININLKQNTLRFIEMDSEKNKKINVDKNVSDEERINILENFKFIKFNMKNYNNMKEITNDKLKDEIYNDGAKYDYIDSITIKNKSKKSMETLKEKIKKLEDELNELKRTTWQTLWLSEIDEFTKKLKLNLKNNWE